MGDVIDLTSRAKRVPPPIPEQEDALVVAVEEQLKAHGEHGGWRLNKKIPHEKQDLAIIARNLAAMRERLPHGAKSEVLRAAGFEGGENPSTYVNNLCLPSGVGDQLEKRMRRLTPDVQKYLNVAVAIEGERYRAIAFLFRGTSLDLTPDCGWQVKMSARFDQIAQRIAAETDLARYFDELSWSNICAAEGADLSFRLTSWLSETFHKTDFAEARHEQPNGAWLYDRSEDRTPKRGAPLFVPMAALDRLERVWEVRSPGTGQIISCVFSSTLSLAIVPIARRLDEACRVACWLFQRPSVSLKGLRKAVLDVSLDKLVATIRSEEAVYEPIDMEGFAAWSTTEEGQLFVEVTDGPIAQADLRCGGWWCVTASPDHIEARLAKPRRQVGAFAVPRGHKVERIMADPSEADDVDYNAAAPDVYPPRGTLAYELSFQLAELQAALTKSADELVAKFRGFKREVALASPLSD